MTTLSFPGSPNFGTVYEAPNNTLYVYDGEKWNVQGSTVTTAASVNFVQDSIAPLFTNIQGDGITFNYNDQTNTLFATVAGYVGTVGNGYTGSKGSTGYTGSAGTNGTNGFTGSIGYAGSSGAAAAIGYTGSTGYSGSNGYTGSIGVGYTGSASTAAGYTGSKGADGTFGAAAFDYYYTTSILDSNPGPGPGDGYIGFNNISFNASTVLRISFIDKSSNSVYSFLQTIDDSTSAIKGHFSVSDKNSLDQYVIFVINGLHIEHADHFDVPISYLSGISSLDDLSEVVITFARTGDIGDPGYTGSQGEIGYTGYTGSNGDIGYTGSLGYQGYTGSKGVTNEIVSGDFTVSLSSITGILSIPAGIGFPDTTYQSTAWTGSNPIDYANIVNVPILPEVDIDGGHALAYFNVPSSADGGGSSQRFGPNSPTINGDGANGTYTNTLDGGGA